MAAIVKLPNQTTKLFVRPDFSVAIALPPKEQKPNEKENRNQYRQTVFKKVAKEARRVRFGLVSDRFDKKVGSVTDVGDSTEEHGPDTDGPDVFGMVGQQKLNGVRA